MAWRMNNAFAPLNKELRIRFPNIVIYGIGDEDHRDEPSDHNPNQYGRVNAQDYMLRNGFDHADAVWLCSWLIQDSRTKYVIFNRRIWEDDGKGWRAYTRKNPHTDHVHHSLWDNADSKTQEWQLEKEEDMDAEDVWGYNTGTKEEPYSAGGRLKTVFVRTGDLQKQVGELKAQVATLSDDLKAVLAALKAQQ